MKWGWNWAISSFTLHNITPLIKIATQCKFYGGGQKVTSALYKRKDSWLQQSFASYIHSFFRNKIWSVRLLEEKYIRSGGMDAEQTILSLKTSSIDLISFKET